MDKGAHFYRCDLQVHTPRDTNWKGTTPVSEADRSAYAATLIGKCRDLGIHAVAITDHHDMAFVSYVRDAATRETDRDGVVLPPEERLVVFPGMELTLGVPCQALLIFDAGFPQDLFSLAMTALAIKPAPDTARKIAQVTRLGHIDSLRALKETLDTHQYLRNRYIVFPHVGENGEFSLIRKGLADKYVDMPCVGGFVDGSLDRVSRGTRNIIDGKAQQWGSKRIACFQTSDSRSEDHAALGRATTWVKWAVPTAEALRQACLAQESRVTHLAPRLPAVSVLGIAVSNSSFLGPVDLQFNRQYNALIGGRGTGKSTILEYLRWALCDQPPPGADVIGVPNYLARRRHLVEQTLKPLNATVDVRFELHGVLHTVRRDSQTGEVSIKISEGEMAPCSADEIRGLLPIQAYSQKQLSDVSVRVEELLRFVTAPVRKELDGIRDRLQERSEAVREAYARVRRRRDLERMLEERRLSENSLSEQGDRLRAGLTGLSDEDQAVLRLGSVYADANQLVISWRDGASVVQEQAARLRETIRTNLSAAEEPPEQPAGATLGEAFGEYRNFLAHAGESIDRLIERAEMMTGPSVQMPESSPWRQWAKALAEFRKGYNAAVERSSAQREQMEQLGKVEEELQEKRRQTNRIRDEVRALGSVEDAYLDARNSWKSLLNAHDDVLDQQCERLTEQSERAIRARVGRYADPAEFVGSLKRLIAGSRVPGGKIDNLGQAIVEAETPHKRDETWEALLKDLERLAAFDLERDGIEKRPEAATLTRLGLTAANLDGIGRQLGLDEWLALSLTPVNSDAVFEYKTREMEYIPFANASAGQQATALLTTLLNQDGPPLIVDQPEEDLDNPVILDIVSAVWKAKQKRQLIFASHNANLVVNGDAELVAWCDYRAAPDQSRGEVVGEGAIDVDDVREAIKRIMEGGERAFNLRKQKYGF